MIKHLMFDADDYLIVIRRLFSHELHLFSLSLFKLRFWRRRQLLRRSSLLDFCFERFGKVFNADSIPGQRSLVFTLTLSIDVISKTFDRFVQLKSILQSTTTTYYLTIQRNSESQNEKLYHTIRSALFYLSFRIW